MSSTKSTLPGSWQAVALSRSVTRDRPLAVSCEGRQHVLFRDGDGAARALEDSCAHRRAPLSLGCITPAGMIECPYHGWRYDGTGACKVIPNLSSKEKVPPAYRVQAFAVHEADGFVQLWTGGSNPSAPPVAYGLEDFPDDWEGERLIAYPHDALIDLLIDAPGAVLDLGPIAPANDHRFGDPAVSEDGIRLQYGVASLAAIRSGKPISDFRFMLEMDVQHDGHRIALTLFDAGRRPLSALVIAARPVKRALSALMWRGAALAPAAGGYRLAPRDRVDPKDVIDAKNYCSRHRLRNVTRPPEGELA